MSALDRFLQRFAVMRRMLEMRQPEVRGEFVTNGVRLSPTEEEAEIRARARAAQLGQTFTEEQREDLDEIDEEVVEQIVDDFLDKHL